MDNSPTKNGVKEILLDKWQDFFDLTNDLFAKSPAYIYRGQTNYEWPLVSSLDRLKLRYSKRKNLGGSIPEFFDRPPLNDDEQLKAFKHAISGRRGPNPPLLSDDECWALGQHHGLATPLLDWTRSPFIALFYAFEEEKYFDVANDKWSKPAHRGVYALSTSTIKEAIHDRDKKSTVRLLSPESDANYRVISQAAIFVRMPDNTHLESYVANHFASQQHSTTFTKIKIPNENRHSCLVALNKMNINYMALFPDIDGAAKHVNSLWQPGHEDSIAYV